MWSYTETFDDFSQLNASGKPRQQNADAGIYALAEQRVYFEPLDPVQGLSMFTRVGVADETANAVDAYVGAGCVYRGLLPERDQDRFGLAIAAAHFGDDYQQSLSPAGPRDDWEIALELTYEARISPWLSIQPTLQHVLNPGGDGTLDDATIVGVRFFARL